MKKENSSCEGLLDSQNSIVKKRRDCEKRLYESLKSHPQRDSHRKGLRQQ
jgi:hypothetical protein